MVADCPLVACSLGTPRDNVLMFRELAITEMIEFLAIGGIDACNIAAC